MMLPNGGNSHPGDTYDRKVLLNQLEVYYKTDDYEKIRLYLKRDLKEKKRIINLLANVEYDIEELIAHLSFLFDNLFTNLLIRRLREALEDM